MPALAVGDRAAGPGGELARVLRGRAEQAGHLVERHGEDVVQHEGDPLLGGERLQDEQSATLHAVGLDRTSLGRDRPAPGSRVDERLGQPRPDVGLAPHPGRAQQSRQMRPVTVVSQPREVVDRRRCRRPLRSYAPAPRPRRRPGCRACGTPRRSDGPGARERDRPRHELNDMAPAGTIWSHEPFGDEQWSATGAGGLMRRSPADAVGRPRRGRGGAAVPRRRPSRRGSTAPRTRRHRRPGRGWSPAAGRRAPRPRHLAARPRRTAGARGAGRHRRLECCRPGTPGRAGRRHRQPSRRGSTPPGRAVPAARARRPGHRRAGPGRLPHQRGARPPAACAVRTYEALDRCCAPGRSCSPRCSAAGSCPARSPSC